MRKIWLSVAAAVLVSATTITSGASARTDESAAVQAATSPEKDGAKAGKHDLKHPLGATQRGLKQKALEAKVAGKTKGKVHEVAKGQYVELERTGTDRIFVIIADFGSQIDPRYGGTPGPENNQIAEPNRDIDNTTIWQTNYDTAHYEDMYFRQMLDYYRTQSSGRYGFNGAVTEWVRVPFNEARYGTNNCGASVCSTVWDLLRSAMNIWTADQLAAGKTPLQLKAYLDTFDVWDRYDHNDNGNFSERDGYIDHFQVVHAGVGEETGGGAQGTDAIWSHRWYAFFDGIGDTGPAFNKVGGTQFGETDMWVGDYTIQPENGGLGVFAHEYGHDLGLPDAYDTNGGENGTGFWTIMSSGSYLGDGTVDIGSRPGDFSAWEKFQLGWLNYEVASAGASSSHRLGPAETNTKQAQGLFVVLPLKSRTLTLATPPEGSRAWWGGIGDNLDNTMTRTVAVPTTDPTLRMKLWWQIERDWDYAYVSVSDGGAYVNLASTMTTNTNPNGQNFGNGITGNSAGWVEASFDMTPYAGESVSLRFRYWTDGLVQEKGILFDDIRLGGFFDGAESSPNGWTLAGFRSTTGSETSLHNHYYLAENRQYRLYDTGLRTGPYNFGFLDTRPNWVEHFPYQDGLQISYWDTSMTDNNTSLHPGEGLILPIDAHPTPLRRPDGTVWRARVQMYDATWGFEPTDPITLHVNSVASSQPSLPAQRLFDDRKEYWFATAPLSSVIVPKTGTTIEVVGVSAQGNFMQVQVKRAK